MILKNTIVSLFLRHFKQCYQANYPENISWLKAKRLFFEIFSGLFLLFLNFFLFSLRCLFFPFFNTIKHRNLLFLYSK